MKKPKAVKKETTTTPAVSVKEPTGSARQLNAEVVSDESVPFTEAKAKELLDMDTFEGERYVNQRHVQNLYSAWKSGRFMWEQVCIGLAQCEGKTYRLNGQHTAWLRANINTNGHDPMVRCVTYKVKNQTELRALYGTFDRNKSRSYSHVVRANLVGLPVCSSVWPSGIGHLSSGLRFWLYGPDRDHSRRVTPDDLVEDIETTYAELWKKVALYWQSKYDVYRPIRRRALVAALFATFEVAPAKSIEFWSTITDAIGFNNKQDPRWQLRRYCDEHTASKSDSKSFVSDERWFCTAIQCWNKWRRNEKMDVLKPTDTRVKAI